MEEESSSTKRSKAPNTNSSQAVAHCLVDGCDADLSLGRDYHRRHKVCEVHSKTPVVIIAGREQRFCQQCSRFHSLVEFDEAKRSCRKRLDGHNRRRRKPQPESMAPNSKMLFVNHHPSPSASGFPSFAPAPIMPPPILPPTWPGFVKAENDMSGLYGDQLGTESFLKFPFKGIDDHHQQQLRFHESSSICSMPGEPRFMPGRQNFHAVDTHGAPSLLSTSPQAAEELNLNQRFGSEGIQTNCNTQSNAYAFNYDPFHRFPPDIKPVVSSAQNHGPTLHFPEMFQHGRGSSDGGSHQTLSFMWE